MTFPDPSASPTPRAEAFGPYPRFLSGVSLGFSPHLASQGHMICPDLALSRFSSSHLLCISRALSFHLPSFQC